MNKLNLVLITIYMVFFSSGVNAKQVLNGTWSPNCGGFGGSILIRNINHVEIEVSSNNIIVQGEIKKNKESYDIYFVKTLDLSGPIFDEGVIDKSKPIANIKFVNGNAAMNWNGFYDKERSSFDVVDNSDFVVANNGKKEAISLHKCNY